MKNVSRTQNRARKTTSDRWVMIDRSVEPGGDDTWGRLQTRFEALIAVVGRKPPFVIEIGGRFHEVQHVKKPEYRIFPAEKPD